MEKSLKLQLDIKNNAQDLQNYMLELSNWEEEMKRKEATLNNEKYEESSIPAPRNKIKRSKVESEKNSIKPKKISAYDYSAWDKFDVEKACAEIDEDESSENTVKEDADQEFVKDECNKEEDESDSDLTDNRLTLIDTAFYEKEMGNNFVKKEQWNDAIKCYTNAINLDSTNAIYYANRSLCFLKLKNFKSAETDATTAIQLDKNYVKAYQRRAFARQALGQLQEAKADYEQILKLEPKNALARVECNKIDEKFEKEMAKIKSAGNKTFDHKNIFRKEEKLVTKESVNSVKKQPVASTTADLSKKQSLKPSDSSKCENFTSKPSHTKENDKNHTSKTVSDEENSKSLALKSTRMNLERGDGDKIIPCHQTAAKDGVFKQLPEWCKIISPVSLPPHKRSKKPLKKINISFSNNDDDINHAVERKVECSDEGEKKSEKINTNKSVEPQPLQYLNKAVEEDELRSKLLSLEVPKTAIQFQKCWKIIKKNPEDAYSYLKKIPGEELPQIFENSLESDLFSELITFLASDDVQKESGIVYNFLLGLTKVKRFSSLILFTSESDKRCLRKAIGELQNVKSKEETSELLKLYELNGDFFRCIRLTSLPKYIVTTMSVNQWKMINHLRDQLAKSVSVKTSEMLTVKKEWANVLKRLPAVVAANLDDNKKRLSSKALGPASGVKVGSKSIAESILEVPQVFNDLKIKLNQKAAATQEEKQTWKTKKSIVSDLSITARTNYILNSIMTAESHDCKAKRIEDLINHFLQYPEGIGTAVKNGAISKLLKFRSRNESPVIQEVLREALTILGYVDPLPNQGIRILSIDGGGIRGLLVMEMLMKLEELTGKKINELFDYICGVSTGSVIACTIGASGKSIKEILDLYKELSNKIFTQNVFFGARSLIWNHGYYDTALWEKLLKEHVGETPLIKTSRNLPCPKIGVISTVTKNDQVVPFIFRNYELPYRVKSRYLGSYTHELWEAARASAAAPTYFEEFRLGEYMHQDGGILVNNPTAVAVHEAKQLWPNSSIQCVVSFGTGRVDPGNFGSATTEKPPIKQTSWKEKFYNILVSATDTEAVHMILNDLLPPSVYFRFNPFVTELLSMDEYQPEKLALLQQDALMYIRRNEEKFQEAAGALLKEKTIYQKLTDWLSVKSVEYCNRY